MFRRYIHFKIYSNYSCANISKALAFLLQFRNVCCSTKVSLCSFDILCVFFYELEKGFFKKYICSLKIIWSFSRSKVKGWETVIYESSVWSNLKHRIYWKSCLDLWRVLLRTHQKCNKEVLIEALYMIFLPFLYFSYLFMYFIRYVLGIKSLVMFFKKGNRNESGSLVRFESIIFFMPNQQ